MLNLFVIDLLVFFLHTNMVAFVHAQLYTDNATNDQQVLCLPAHLSSVIDVWIRNHGMKRNPFSPLIVQPPREERITVRHKTSFLVLDESTMIMASFFFNGGPPLIE